MKVESLNLHNLGLVEALEKARSNLLWCIEHEVDLIDFNHGKGLHSQRGIGVIKQELRRFLKDNENLRSSGYRVVPGESDMPIALGFDEGHTLVVKRGLEQEYADGQKQRYKKEEIYSPEGRQKRKLAKAHQASKRQR